MATGQTLRKLRLCRRSAEHLTATEARREIERGALSAEEYVTACLDRIEALDGDVRAFAPLDGRHALGQARSLDEWRRMAIRRPVARIPVP